MDFISEVANLGVAAAGIVAAGWASAKWWRRPRFICGIPPSVDERKRADPEIDRKRLGEFSVATAFRHEPHCFAERLFEPDQEHLSKSLEQHLLTDRERTRFIATDERRRASVPVLIANCGKRVADYSASITFYADGGKVHVTDVVTETAPVYLYADQPELVADVDRVRCADKRIVEGYNDYLMDGMTRWGDVVVLSGGHLEASLFELAVVDVVIEPDLESFFVVLSVDCADFWTGAQTFIQGCRVNPDGGVAEPSVARAEAS